MEVQVEKVILANELLWEYTKVAEKYVVATVETPLGLRATGISRTSEGDKFDYNLGMKIAKGRALKCLMKKLNHEKINDPLMG